MLSHWLDSCIIALDESVLVRFLQGKLVVDIVWFKVRISAILPNAKQLPPRGRQSSCSTKSFRTTGCQPHSGQLSWSQRQSTNQRQAGRSLQRKVDETTIRAQSELLYTVFHCYLVLLSLSMLFVSIPGFTRWLRRSLSFQPSSNEVAFFQAEVVHDGPPDRPYPTGAEILLVHFD